MSNNHKVLIADDEPLLLKLLSKVLKRMGHVVIAVSDGLAAVEAFKVYSDEIRLVVLDMNMPNMDGATAFHALLESGAEIPILISSGDGAEQVLSRLKSEPAGLISKPYDLNQLRKILSEFLS